MGLQAVKECEQKNMDKLINFKLPYYWKKIGWGLFIFCLVAVLTLKFVEGSSEFLKNALKRGLLASLFIVVLSREIIEDERIQQIRARAFSFTFLITAIYILFQPIANLIVDSILGQETPVFDNLGDFVILWLMLVVYLVFYTMLKKK
jgi:uncharacterized membrane protein